MSDPALEPSPGEANPAPPQALDRFGDRVRGVLLAPWQAFALHDASWGWIKPWLLVALLGILSGVVLMNRVDLAAMQREAAEQQLEQLHASGKLSEDEYEEAREGAETGLKMVAFVMKIMAVAGPPLLGLLVILVVGGLIFLGARFLGGLRRPPDLMLCVSIAAYAALVDGLALLPRTVGYYAGNVAPSVGPGAFVNALEQPLLAAVLGRLDAFVIYYYLVLSAGLEAAGGLRRGRARLVAGLIYAGLSALLIGGAAIQQAFQG